MKWDDRDYQIGIERGVFYPNSGPGEAWNGLVAVKDNPDSAQPQTRYIDGVKTYLSQSEGYFAGSIEAFTYPESLYTNVLMQRRVPRFGLSYKTRGENHYRIHLVYNIVVDWSNFSYLPRDVDTFEWNFSTLPVDIPGASRTAHLIIETNIAYESVVQDLEDILYGTNSTDPRLPSPEEVISVFEENALLRVIDHGDGTFTIIGPDEALVMLDSTTFEVTWPSVVNIDADTYQISSL